jgi:hypothetical protein
MKSSRRTFLKKSAFAGATCIMGTPKSHLRAGSQLVLPTGPMPPIRHSPGHGLLALCLSGESCIPLHIPKNVLFPSPNQSFVSFKVDWNRPEG